MDGSGDLPYFKDVFEPGTMMPKEGLTNTREGLRKYVGAFVYNKDMVTEEYLDHLMELSARWNDLYMKHKGKEYWEKNGMQGASEMYYFDGAHIRDHVHKISVPTLVMWGAQLQQGHRPRLRPLQEHPRRPDAHLRPGQPLHMAGPAGRLQQPGDVVPWQGVAPGTPQRDCRDSSLTGPP